MSEQAIAAIVKRALGRLAAELTAMDEDDRGFERMRSEAPTFYSERSHALAMASHIQGLFSQAENLLKQVTEQLGDELRKTEAWHKQLLEIAAVEVPGVRSAILGEDAFTGLESMLRMRHVIRSNDAGTSSPLGFWSSSPKRGGRFSTLSTTSTPLRTGWSMGPVMRDLRVILLRSR